MADISLSAAERLLKKAGAERVSKKAAEEFISLIEDIALDIGREIVEVAEHTGRKTVKEADVKFVEKKL